MEDDSIDWYISNLNTPSSSPTPPKKQPARKKNAGKKSDLKNDRYDNISHEEFESICYRATLLYTKGTYYPPEKSFVCKKKERTKAAPKLYNPEKKKKSTTFGKGRVGLSCESYGVINCSCCKSSKAPPDLFTDFAMSPFNYFNVDAYAEYAGEATEDEDLVVINPFKNSQQNKLSTIINISDEELPSTSLKPAPVDMDYIDLVNNEEQNTKIQEYEQRFDTLIKSELDNKVKSIASSTNILNTTTNIINTEEKDVKPIIEHTTSNINEGNIMDYINLVADEHDYDEEVRRIREYEEQFLLLISKEIESASAAAETIISPETIITNSEPHSQQNINTTSEANSQENINTTSEANSQENNHNSEINSQENININYQTNPQESNNITSFYSQEIKQTNNVPGTSFEPKILRSALKDVTPTNTSVTRRQWIKYLNKNLGVIEIKDSPSPKIINRNRKQIVESRARSPNILECAVCLEVLKGKEIMSTICGHLFCAPCIREAIKTAKFCPICRRALTLKSIHPVYI